MVEATYIYIKDSSGFKPSADHWTIGYSAKKQRAKSFRIAEKAKQHG